MSGGRRPRRGPGAALAPLYTHLVPVSGPGVGDLRPSGASALAAFDGPTAIVSGPDDLAELRACVEQVCGAESWPAPTDDPPPGWELVERRRSVVEVEPARLGQVVAALGEVVSDRVAQWRTWRTAVEAVMAAWDGRRHLTLEAAVWTRSPSPSPPAIREPR